MIAVNEAQGDLAFARAATRGRIRYWLALLGLGFSFASGTAMPACPTGNQPLPPLINPGGPIEKRWKAVGCDTDLGSPLSAQRRDIRTGITYQDFTNGQITIQPHWARDKGSTMGEFVLSAHKVGKGIHVQWGDTAPFAYERFNIRWDRDDHDEAIAEQHEHTGGFLGIGASSDPQQIEVEGDKTHGAAIIPTKGPTTYLISVEGCEDDGPCPQGWSYPVEVDLDFIVLSKASTLTPPPSQTPSPPMDLPDGPSLNHVQARLAFADQCTSPQDMLEEDGELQTGKARAVVQAIRDPLVPCRHGQKLYSTTELRDLLNQSIKASTVESVPGTDASMWLHAGAGAAAGVLPGALLGLLGPMGPLAGALLGGGVGALLGGVAIGEPGDYDMHLMGLIPIAFQADYVINPSFPNFKLLEDSTKRHLFDKLLTVRGGASERREFLYLAGLPTPIPETENHILMTEAARYLTNELLASEYRQAGKPVPKDFDNDQNGMRDWWLLHLQSFVTSGFYEYNSRPYSREAMGAISNLYEYSAALAPDSCWRSNPPDPTQPPLPRACDVRRAARIVMDYEAAKFALGSLGLRRTAPYRRQTVQRHYTRLMGRQSDSMTWRYLALSGGEQLFWDGRFGRLSPAFSGSVTTPLLGSYRVPSMITQFITDNNQSYFQRFYFDRGGYPGVELYYREPVYLISAGGVFDHGWGPTSDENAWALPTTLMPTRDGLDYRGFVQIAGARDDSERVNTCIGPGFACGLNPEIPSGVPEACIRRDGNWTFLDFNKDSPGCDIDYDYYVVVYREKCDTGNCRDQAGDSGSFGFFEVTPPMDGLEQLEDFVTAANSTWDYRSDAANVYNGATGRRFTFQPIMSDRLKWGLVSLEEGGALTSFEQSIRKWPLAQGELLRSDGHKGCITIDNPALDQRLILDYTDAMRPARTRLKISTASRECRCPLPTTCLPPRYE